MRIYERIGSHGKMITYWGSTKGHWLEWDVPVGEAGGYRIHVRYCSGGADPHHALTMDGKSPGAAFDDMALAPTGGTTVNLTAGKRRLRLTNLGDGVGLDYILLVRQ